MLSGLRVVVGGAVLCLSLSCGKSAEQQPEPSLSTKEELAAEMASVMCESRGGCCTADSIAFDASACRTTVVKTLTALWTEDEDNGLQYDAQLGAECLVDIAALVDCGEVDDSGNTLQACDNLMHGDLEPGEACEIGEDCQVEAGQTATCPDGICIVSTRQQAVHGKAGEPCRTTCEQVECILRVAPTPEPEGYDGAGAGVGCFHDDGLYCDEVCRERAGLGEPCLNDNSCIEGAFCKPEVPPQGTCVARYEDGADCFENPPACRGFCDEETWQCSSASRVNESYCADYD